MLTWQRTSRAVVLLPVPLAFASSTRLWTTSGSVRMALCLLASAVFGAILLFLPGLAVLWTVERSWTVGGRATRTTLAVAASGCIHWLLWWVWVVNVPMGRVLAVAVWVASCILAGAFVPRLRGVGAAPVVALGLAVTMAVACVGVLGVHGGLAVIPEIASRSTYHTADNFFPQVWIDRVEAGEDLTAPSFYDFPLGDRPPVQSAWVIPGYDLSANKAFAHEVLAAVLQGLAVSASAVLLLAVGLRRRRLLAALALSVCTAFVFLNTVFVWPKLLPAALLLLVIASLIEERGQLTAVGWAAVGASAGLSAVAHPGGLFALPAVLVVVIRERAWPRGRRSWLSGIGAGALAIAPWAIYRLGYDHSSSVLLRWQLAGVDVADVHDDRSLVRLILDRYRELGPTGWLRQRAHNFSTFIGWDFLRSTWRNPADWRSTSIVMSMFSPVWTAGVLVLTAPLLAFVRRYPRALATTALASAVGMIVWSVIEFGPPIATTTTQQGSYGLFLLLAITLAGVASFVLPRWALAALVAAQLALTTWAVWPLGGEDGCDVTNLCLPRTYGPGTTSSSRVLFPVLATALIALAVALLLSSRLATPDDDDIFEREPADDHAGGSVPSTV